MFETSIVDGVGWLAKAKCDYICLDDDSDQVLLCRLEDSVDNMVYTTYLRGFVLRVID